MTGPRLVFSQCYVSDHFLVLFCAPWASLISLSIPTLAAGAGTIPSRDGYILSMLNTLISHCCVNGICCLDPTHLQITALCMLHSMYNDKVSEIGEVPKLFDRLLDCQYMPLGHTNFPWWFKQDNLVELLDNFLDDSLLKL